MSDHIYDSEVAKLPGLAPMQAVLDQCEVEERALRAKRRSVLKQADALVRAQEPRGGILHNGHIQHGLVLAKGIIESGERHGDHISSRVEPGTYAGVVELTTEDKRGYRLFIGDGSASLKAGRGRSWAPTEADVEAMLALVAETLGRPVLEHWKAGVHDQTGYSVVVKR
jgi:hypothetical protein